MLFGIACGSSPTEDSNSNEKIKEPSLEGMVFIPAGEFLMGSPEGEGAYDEHPQHKIYLDAYYIDKYEVTHASFKKFVEATGYVTDAERIGSGYVWNPKDESYGPLSMEGVNWRYPNKWMPERPYYPNSWENYKEVVSFINICAMNITIRMGIHRKLNKPGIVKHEKVNYEC
jgi:formylglycine-generating enzyme required for sulfatase activity